MCSSYCFSPPNGNAWRSGTALLCYEIRSQDLCAGIDWFIEWLCRWNGTSKPRSPTGLCSSPGWYMRVVSHGNDYTGWGKLLTRLPQHSGSPTSRVVWEQVGGIDEGVRSLPIHYLKYLKGSLTCRRILWHESIGLLPIRRKVCCGSLSH
jgi:hypothetical protein